MDELDLYDQYMSFARLSIIDAFVEEQEMFNWHDEMPKIDIVSVEVEPKGGKPNKDWWIFLATIEYRRERMPLGRRCDIETSLHTMKVMSYSRWRLMVQRDKKLEELLKKQKR